jgi:hypothetical protein
VFLFALAAEAQNTAVFPGALPDYNDLFVAKNRAQTTLTGALTASNTTINVTSTGDFDDTGLITIDNEIIATCAKTGTTFTVGRTSCPNADGRGFDGTSAASHTNGSTVQARIVAFHHNQVAAEVLAIAGKLNRELVSVKDYGAVGDGVNDDRQEIQAAFDAAEDKCIWFPGGTYKISQYVNLKASNSCLLGGPNVIIDNAFGVQGYEDDGFRIGDASETDGGTGTAINISDVYVSGFHFTNTRIGVWVVYARRVTVENISSSGVAVVAVGNDADDDCEHIIVRNVIRTAVTSSDWYTVGIFNTDHFVLDGVISPFAVQNGPAVPVTTSNYGTVSNLSIDQQDSAVGDCIALLDSHYITVSNFFVRNCRKGVVIYSGTADLDQFHRVGPGTVISSAYGMHIYTRKNLISGVYTVTSGTASVLLATDAQTNYFIGNVFSEGTIEDASGVVGLQKWHANIGLRENSFSGDVGIGTAAQAFELHIQDAVRSRILLQGDNENSTDIASLHFGAGVRGDGSDSIIASIIATHNENSSTTGGVLDFYSRPNNGSLTLRFSAKDWPGIVLNGNEAAPTCNAARRGTIYYGAAGTGVADSLSVCSKDSSDNYAFRALY